MRFEVRVAGPVPHTVRGMIQLRFADVLVRRDAHTTVLDGTVVDQPAIRALLGMIWDAGGSILLLTVNDEPEARGR
jgi:hypothetical protein